MMFRSGIDYRHGFPALIANIAKVPAGLIANAGRVHSYRHCRDQEVGGGIDHRDGVAAIVT
jgi:hypothetical protein